MAGVINELVTKFDFQGSTKPLTDYNSALGSSIKLTMTGVAAVASAAAGFAAWTSSILAGIDPVVQLSRQTKVAVGTIQELGYVASVSGSSADALQGTIASLSQKIGEAAQKGSADFARLGISVRDANGQVKSADTVLAEVGNRFKQLGLSMNEQAGIAGALGIDSSLLQMLNKTNSEIDGLRANARAMGVLSQEQADNAVKFNDAMTTLKFGLSSVKQMMAVGLAPEMARLAEAFSKLLADNKDWIISGLQWTARVLGDTVAAIGRLMPVLGLMAGGFVVAKVAALGFGGVMAIVFSPVTLITAAIAAVLLIIDDLIVAMNGGKSVIRDFFQEWFGIDIVPIIQGIIDKVKEVIGLFIDFNKAIVNLGGAAGRKIMEFFGGGEDTIAPGAGSGAAISNNSVNQQVKIDVRADDPAAAGQAVADSLQRQLDNANTQLGRGGR